MPLPMPTTGSSPTTQALNVSGLLHHVNTCDPVVQQLKLLFSTWAQRCHHCHSSLASPPIPGISWDICCPWSRPTAELGGTAPRRQCLPPERRGWWFRGVFSTQLGFFSQSLILPHLNSPLSYGLQCQHICTSLCYSILLPFFWGNGVAPAWQWVRARPLPRRGRQAVCFPQTPVVAGGCTCSNNHCCLPGSSASSPCSLCSPGINRSVRCVVWAGTWGLRPPSAHHGPVQSQAHITLLAQPGAQVEQHHQVQVLLWGWRCPHPLGLYKTHLFLCTGALTLTRGAALCKTEGREHCS